MVSGLDLFFSLFNNLAIFIALVSVYGYLTVLLRPLKSYQQKIIIGITFGFFAIGCMYAKIPVFEGVLVDQRNAIIALSSVFGGPVAGYLSAFLAGLFRFHLGGQGVLAGIIGLTLAATSGVLLLRTKDPFGSVPQALMSSFIAVIIILPGFLFVKDFKTGFNLMLNMALPYGFAIFAGILFVGLLLHRETNKIRVEQLLRASEQRFQSMFRLHDTAMMIIDPNTQNIIDANNAALSFYGYTHDEIQQKKITDINEAPSDEVLLAVNKILQGDQDFFEFDHRLANGDLRHVEVQASPIRVKSEVLIFSIIHDATARKERFDEQKRSAQLAALGTIAAGVAHEINNPIQGIMNYATLIENNPEKIENNSNYSKQILKESHRIAGITKDLLYFSKNGSNQKISSDICGLVESALSLIQTKARQHGIDIETYYEEGLPKVAVQPQGIQQVVINLVDNAIHAVDEKITEASDRVVKVSVGLLKIGQPQHLFIEVYDRGTGMDSDTLSRAKEAFYSTKSSSPGAGLGLYIVNEIVSTHNGKLIIDSVMKEYTKVTAYLPVEEDDRMIKHS